MRKWKIHIILFDFKESKFMSVNVLKISWSKVILLFVYLFIDFNILLIDLEFLDCK